MKALVPEGWIRTPNPVSLSSQAIQGLSAGWRASTVRLVSVVRTLAVRFSGVDCHAGKHSDRQVYGQHCGQHLKRTRWNRMAPHGPFEGKAALANLLNITPYVPATVRQYPLCPNINTSLIT